MVMVKGGEVIRICFWAVPPEYAREAGTNPGLADNKGTMAWVGEPCQGESPAGFGRGEPGRARGRVQGRPSGTPPDGTVGVGSGERGYAATTCMSKTRTR